MMSQYLKKLLLLPLLFSIITLSVSISLKGQSIHVFPDGELNIFDQFTLNTTPGATWSTTRSVTPGYFSAVGDAVFTGAAHGTSYLVDGYVKYYVDNSTSVTSFTFPLGEATTYRPLTISGMPNTGSFAAAWFSGDPNITIDPTDGSTHNRINRGTSVLAVLSIGFWDWQTISGTAAGMSITLSIPDVSAQSGASSLILVGWNGTNWINLSGTAGTGPYGGSWANGNTEGSALTGTGQPGISALAIGSLSFTLPLKLESFTGKSSECTARLNWKTSEEINTSHFIIESSTDGLIWKAHERIAAQGNGNGRAYQYTTSQSELQQFYRLQMADLDGKTSYSQVISLRSECGESFMNLSPNPVTPGAGKLKIVLQTSYQGKASLILRNMSGQLLLNQPVTLQKGTNLLNLESSGLRVGSYLVTITDVNGHPLAKSQTIIKN